MGKLRSVFVLLAALAFVVGACGDETPSNPSDGEGGSGVGGSGGDVGTGGAGGEGGPVVTGFVPERAGPGTRIRVEGANLSSSAPRNSVYFAATEGSTQPTLQSKGVAADPDGTWFQVDVPMNAKSGPTLVTVETEKGTVTVSGPDFVVTDDKLPPVVNSVNPSLITADSKDVRITITGTGFYPEVTKLHLNELGQAEEEHPIDWSASNMTRVVFTLPASMAERIAHYVAKLVTPPPGGGQSIPHSIQVVAPLNLIEAEAVAKRQIRATFDQPVSRVTRSTFRILDVRNGVTNAVIVHGSGGRQVDVILNEKRTWQAGETYTLQASASLTTSEGGEIRNREVTFQIPVSGD